MVTKIKFIDIQDSIDTGETNRGRMANGMPNGKASRRQSKRKWNTQLEGKWNQRQDDQWQITEINEIKAKTTENLIQQGMPVRFKERWRFRRYEVIKESAKSVSRPHRDKNDTDRPIQR